MDSASRVATVVVTLAVVVVAFSTAPSLSLEHPANSSDAAIAVMAMGLYIVVLLDLVLAACATRCPGRIGQMSCPRWANGWGRGTSERPCEAGLVDLPSVLRISAGEGWSLPVNTTNAAARRS